MTDTSHKKQRDIRWFRIHSWIGLKLSILMTFVLVTGTFAVVSADIDWLLAPEMRTLPAYDGPVAWGAAYDAANREFPAASVISLERSTDAWFATQALIRSPWEQMGRAWMDPASGDYQGFTRWMNVQRFFRMTHRHLMLPTPIGIPIVTILAVPLFLSLVAGLVIYKGFWRGLFKWPRFGRNTRIWAGDLHRLMGLWSSWLLILIVITSLWYLAELLGARAPAFPKGEMTALEEPMITLSGSDIDGAVIEAERLLPGLKVRRIVLPSERDQRLTVTGDLSAALVRPRANAVVFDPRTLTVLAHYRGEEASLHTRISEAADPLHFGYFGGWWTKSLWFVVGAALSGLSITGCVIYGKRALRKASRAAPQTYLGATQA